jgi:hypothetical protein
VVSLPGIGNAKLDVLGVGSINIAVKVNGVTTPRILQDVLYVAGLGVNLFSIGAATANGLKACFENNKVESIYLSIYTCLCMATNTPSFHSKGLIHEG